jgi:hypothetical protein
VPLLNFTIYLVTFDQFYHSDYNVHCGYDSEKIRKEEMALVDNGQTVHPQISANRTVWNNLFFNKKGTSILCTQNCEYTLTGPKPQRMYLQNPLRLPEFFLTGQWDLPYSSH